VSDDGISAPLSAEEWEAGKFTLLHDDELTVYRDPNRNWGLSFRRDDEGEVFNVEVDSDMHALAAFALQGHPAGFTWADVLALDTVIQQVLTDPRQLSLDVWDALGRYATIVSRIKALLPLG
jgi:hypothetical protein